MQTWLLTQLPPVPTSDEEFRGTPFLKSSAELIIIRFGDNLILTLQITPNEHETKSTLLTTDSRAALGRNHWSSVFGSKAPEQNLLPSYK